MCVVVDAHDLGVDDEDVLGEDHKGDAKDRGLLVWLLMAARAGSRRLVWFLRLPAVKVLWRLYQPQLSERGHSRSEGKLTEGERSVLPLGSAGSSSILRRTILSGQ